MAVNFVNFIYGKVMNIMSVFILRKFHEGHGAVFPLFMGAIDAFFVFQIFRIEKICNKTAVLHVPGKLYAFIGCHAGIRDRRIYLFFISYRISVFIKKCVMIAKNCRQIIFMEKFKLCCFISKECNFLARIFFNMFTVIAC